VKKRPHFQALTPLYPDERIKLETYAHLDKVVSKLGNADVSSLLLRYGH
jgi:transcription termination factor Rho